MAVYGATLSLQIHSGRKNDENSRSVSLKVGKQVVSAAIAVFILFLVFPGLSLSL